jgi:murein DD-endopeptidase MepM/ murein hydrolase activator NlpD
MRRALATAALTLVLAPVLTAGPASADIFAVLPPEPTATDSTTADIFEVVSTEVPTADTFKVVSPGPAILPSADVPNPEGSVLMPSNAFEAPFGAPQERSNEELQALWLRAGAAYGIPWQVLAAINKIESNLGRNMGPSSAGAVGWMQFMPDTWLRWGTDGDGDGLADPWDPEDAVFAAARYLAATGGTTDITRAIFAYNHAQWYVDEVLGLASLFGGDVDVVFTLDKLAIRLDEAQTAVAETSKALREAKSRAAELQLRVTALDDRAAAADLLLSDRLDVEREAFEADQENAAAAAEVQRLQAQLTTAEEVLDQARTGAHAASFNPAAAGILGGPSRADGYVFPVGGGPAFVSVGHTHHDYPAADIAAPEGSPVFALADSIVLDTVDDGRCGTGIILQTADGIHWLYCHLSQRDPIVLPGAVLSAGQWVGLVGSTGDATGPHLHLALKPETSYPQDMTWFQEFAGTAFAWQDAPTAPPADPFRSSPVFAVAPSVDVDEEVVEFTTAPSRG